MIKKIKNTNYNKNFKRCVLRDTRYMIRGFTLIELLVTISIAAILMVAGIPGFRNYKNFNDLSNTAKIIQSEIYKARSLALAPATDKVQSSDYYYLDLQNNSVSIGECKVKFIGSIPSCDSAYPIKNIESYNIPSTYTLSRTEVNQRIFFSIINYGRIPPISGTAKLHMQLENNKTKKSVYLTLNLVTGQVLVCNDKTTCN